MSRQTFKPFTKIFDVSTNAGVTIRLNDSATTGHQGHRKWNYISVECSSSDVDNYFMVQPLGGSTTTANLGASSAGAAPASGVMLDHADAPGGYYATSAYETSGFCGVASTGNRGAVEMLLGPKDMAHSIKISQYSSDRSRYFVTYGNIKHTNGLDDNLNHYKGD
tara:strand:- start:429 stop:923 length:495 start_codon:yes stop_codon:yes gene_type:complete